MRYDVCVLGAGPAGYAAAMRAWDLGKRVALVEVGRLGGAGLHDGALSSKTMWELSRDYRRLLSTDRGYRCTEVEMNYPAMMECVATAVREKERQTALQLAALAGTRGPNGGSLTHIEGRGRFESPHSVRVTGEGGPPVGLEADAFVIATGPRGPVRV